MAIADQQAIIRMWHQVIIGCGALAMAAAASSFTLTEIGRISMVIAHDIQKWLERRAEKRDNKLRQEGRAEERQLWEDWNTRRIDAEARGEPFSEPPPSP